MTMPKRRDEYAKENRRGAGRRWRTTRMPREWQEAARCNGIPRAATWRLRAIVDKYRDGLCHSCRRVTHWSFQCEIRWFKESERRLSYANWNQIPDDFCGACNSRGHFPSSNLSSCLLRCNFSLADGNASSVTKFYLRNDLVTRYKSRGSTLIIARLLSPWIDINDIDVCRNSR